MNESHPDTDTKYMTSAQVKTELNYSSGYWDKASEWWDSMTSENKKKTADFISKLPSLTGEPLFIRAYGMRRNSILKWFWKY